MQVAVFYSAVSSVLLLATLIWLPKLLLLKLAAAALLPALAVAALAWWLGLWRLLAGLAWLGRLLLDNPDAAAAAAAAIGLVRSPSPFLWHVPTDGRGGPLVPFAAAVWSLVRG
jgi:hypothetical protein